MGGRALEPFEIERVKLDSGLRGRAYRGASWEGVPLVSVRRREYGDAHQCAGDGPKAPDGPA